MCIRDRQKGRLSYLANPDRFWNTQTRYPCLTDVVHEYTNDRYRQVQSETAGVDATELAAEDQKHRVPFDENVAFLRKIVLPASERPRLRHLLVREGYSKAALMPTFDNIATEAMASCASIPTEFPTGQSRGW